MDLVRSWLAAFAAYLVTMWGTALLGQVGGDRSAYASFGGRLLWLYVPLLLAYAIIAAAAAGTHTRPRRENRGRHLAAVLPVPVLMMAFSVTLSIGGPVAVSGLVLSILFAVAGSVIGWLGADRLWRWFSRDREAYF